MGIRTSVSSPIHQPFLRRLKHIPFLKLLPALIPVLFLAIGIVVGVANLETIRLWFAGASGQEADIRIDTVSVIGTLPRPWRNLAQGGEEASWNMQPVIGKVKALNPEYIRIDHIYDFYEIVSKQDGKLSYNWSKVDVMVNNIIATGAKPYIALSYMPSAISASDIIDKPTNWGEYQQVIEATIRHFSKERGIDGVVYEVWNEPDLFGKWKVYGDKNYLQLYRSAAQAAIRVRAQGSQSFKIGGPATTALYKNWVDSLVKMVSDEQLPLDFISWHHYAKDLTAYEEDVQNIQDWLAYFPQLPNLELHVTEWGHNSNNDKGYDGAYGAAHTAAVSIATMGKIDRMFVFEIQDGKDPAGQVYWGRWGLLTHQDFGSTAKPRYNALKFIDQIGTQRLPLQGNGTWVKGMAARNGDSVQVILANYDPIGSHTETVPVTFTNLEYNRFLVEHVSLAGARRVENVATTEAQLQVTVPMLPNSVVMVTLTPQGTNEQTNPAF